MNAENKHLHALLQSLREERHALVEERYQRSLPFAELLFDRWERAGKLGFGQGASIYDSAIVFGTITVGEQTWVGPNVILDGSAAPLRIGAFCSISAGTHVYTHDSVGWAISGGVQDMRSGPVSIGDRCHLGAQCIVVCGVSIGEQCVIGANSFVNHDVPPRTVVAGSPARPIGRVVGEGAQAQIVINQGRDSHDWND